MRGRKPKPTTLHALHGTLNATRHRGRKAEPIPEGALGAPPDWFTESQAAAWAYSVEHAPKGVLHRIDRGVLVIWCEAEDRHRTAAMQQARLDRGNSLPLLTKGKDGQPVVSAYVNIITKAAIVMLKAASELGFSPAARPRLAQQTGELAAKTSAWTRLKVINGGKGAA